MTLYEILFENEEKYLTSVMQHKFFEWLDIYINYEDVKWEKEKNRTHKFINDFPFSIKKFRKVLNFGLDFASDEFKNNDEILNQIEPYKNRGLIGNYYEFPNEDRSFIYKMPLEFIYKFINHSLRDMKSETIEPYRALIKDYFLFRPQSYKKGHLIDIYRTVAFKAQKNIQQQVDNVLNVTKDKGYYWTFNPNLAEPYFNKHKNKNYAKLRITMKSTISLDCKCINVENTVKKMMNLYKEFEIELSDAHVHITDYTYKVIPAYDPKKYE